MSGGTSELDKLIQESEDAIKRLDDLQKRKQNTPFLQRVSKHLHKNSPHLINVLLAGSVLVVALGRLAQKQEHQAEKAEWEEQQRQLVAEKQKLEQQAHALQSSTETLVQGLEAAAAKGGRDLPRVVRDHLAAWRQQLGTHPQLSPAAAAAGGAALPGASSSDGEGGDSKIMI